MKKIRILAFGHIPTWAGGRQSQGAANVIYNLALNMSRLPNAEVHLGCTDVFKETVRVENLTIHGWTKLILIKYILIHPMLSLRYFSKLIVLRRQVGEYVDIFGMFFKGVHLRRCIDNVNPDVIHMHGFDVGIYMSIIPERIKLVVTIHGMAGGDSMINGYKSAELLENTIWHSVRINKIYMITSKLVYDFQSLYGNNLPPIEVILNAYNDEYFYFKDVIMHDGLVVCTVATMSDRKGQERVLDGLIKSGRRCHYICVGSIDKEIAQRMESKASASNVVLDIQGTKSPDEIREVLLESDYMILPSSSEGFGLVYLESIACGTPVVLPKELPICSEKGMIIPDVNAILLDDSSSNAISDIVPQLETSNFNRQAVSNTIIAYNWISIARQYFDSFVELCS